jgi:rare lipoprotein A
MNMSSISCAGASCEGVDTGRVRLDRPVVAAAGARKIIQLVAVVLGAASLAACAQSSVVTGRSELGTVSQQPSLEHNRKIASVITRRIVVAKKHTPFKPDKNVAETQVASNGVASFYTEGTQTANGEKFDTHELTAAHRTLPFGTRLRVTNVATGKTVTVRVNDRGPFIPGRVVDVSYAAAETLGMVDGGIAKVKLDVVH